MQQSAPTEPEYEYLPSTANRACVRLRLQPELLYFRGHYADAPILPGVTQLHWAIRQAQQLFAVSGDPVEAKAIKFHNVIRPNDVVDLELEFDEKRRTVSYRYVSPAGLHSSGRLHWPAAG